MLLIVLYSLLLLSIVPLQTMRTTEERCTYCSRTPEPDKQNVYNCSHCMLHSIPNFPSSASTVDLSFNYISTIGSRDFKELPHLTELYLGQNNLSVIERNSFSVLQSLQRLVLSNNRLNCASLETLRSVKKLRYLDIRGNMYKRYPESITFLYNLNILKIDIFRNFLFNDSFSSLKNLTKIIFNPKGMVTLRNNSFEGLQNSPIQRLVLLLADKIEGRIGINFLRPFCYLKELILNISRTFDIKDVMKILHGIRNRKLNHIDISNNNWFSNRHHHLTAKDASNLLTICVKEINLSYNNIYYFPFLESLDTNFFNCLEKLILSNNDMIWTSSQLIGLMSYPSLRMLDVSMSFPHPRQTYVSHNFPKQYDFHLNFTTNFWTEIEEINISGLDLSGFISASDSFTLYFDFPKLRVLNARNSSWTICTYDVRFNPGLTRLDMSGWDCFDLNQMFLQRHPGITFLNASKSQLGEYLNSKISQSMLLGLLNLSTIDLSNNNINYLRNEFFRDQEVSLENIHINNNNLREIPEAISVLQRLRFVDLSFNNFAFFNKQDIKIMEKFKDTVFNFGGNKFECTCTYIDSLVWMSSTENIGDNIICRDGTNMTVLLKDIHYFQLRCISTFWLDFAITLLFLLVLIILVAALGYRNKSFVIYLYIKTRRLIKQSNREIDVNNFEFDVFVSYTNSDYHWATTTFFDFLSKDLKLKVCMFDKDYIPGVPISEEILRCVESSRRYIFVITEYFLQSEWRLFEMDIARYHVSKRETDTIIVILKDCIPLHEMPSTLRKIWWRILCIKYPQNNSQVELDLFYKNISEVLQT